MLKRTLATTLLLLCVNQTAIAEQLTPAYEADIRALLEETGSAKLGSQMGAFIFRTIAAQIKTQHPAIKDSTLDKLGQRMEALMMEESAKPGGMIDLILPIYAKHFNHDDIKQLLDFYRSPVGRKSIQLMPVILSESTRAGEQWGTRLQPKVREIVERTLREDGLKK